MLENAAPPIDQRSLVAPELQPLLGMFPRLELTAESLAAMRSPQAVMQSALARPPLSAAQETVRCEEVFLPGLGSAPAVRALLYTPPNAVSCCPGYLHIHGGGYVLGTPEFNDGANRDIVLQQRCIVLSVDYRLAPETRFPGALEDCYAALAWLHGQAAGRGIDTARIAIGGESAGGGHAAALALLARDRGEYPICFQLLDCPMLDDRTNTPGFEGLTWSAAQNRFGWQALLGCEPGTDDVPEGSVPARVENLAGLPPACIVVGAVDLFAAENLLYAQRLIAAGVPTELHVIPGAFHGFGVAGGASPQSRALMRYRAEALTRAFATAAQRSTLPGDH